MSARRIMYFTEEAKTIYNILLNGTYDEFRVLLECGCNINSRFTSDETPLIWASRIGKLREVSLLVEKGCDLDAVDCKKWSALMFACYKVNHNVARFLIKSGCNPNLQCNQGRTALMWASVGCDLIISNLLIEGGADLNLKDDCGDTAFSLACRQLMCYTNSVNCERVVGKVSGNIDRRNYAREICCKLILKGCDIDVPITQEVVLIDPVVSDLVKKRRRDVMSLILCAKKFIVDNIWMDVPNDVVKVIFHFSSLL